MNSRSGDIGRLLLQGPDAPGIVAAVSTFLRNNNANILESAQHTTDAKGGTFFQRVVFERPRLSGALPGLLQDFESEVATSFGLECSMTPASVPKRVALFVSRYDHALSELLWRVRRGELHMTPTVVISNHADLEPEVASFGVPYAHIPVSRDSKREAEDAQLRRIRGRVDLVVLARYMQILSPSFLATVGCPVINIHHSFLPAFAGAAPYERAHERGVKLVGATAHYVTEELDAGPIIEQDVVRVSHADDTAALQRRGAHVEREVLARAVAWHCEDRVVLDGNKTIVFGPLT